MLERQNFDSQAVQRAKAPAATPPPPAQSASFEQFLVDSRVMPMQLLPAFRLAMRHSGATSLEVAADENIVDEKTLYKSLAVFHDLPFLNRDETWLKVEVEAIEVESCLKHLWLRLRGQDGRTFVIAAPRDPSARLLRHLGVPGAGGHRVIDCIATPTLIRTLIDRAFSAKFTEKAIWHLARTTPEFSAHRRLVPWQAAVLAAIAVSLGAGAWVAPVLTTLIAGSILAVFFLAVTTMRLICLFTGFTKRREIPNGKNHTAISEQDLPIYTVLVPLYHEADIIHQTVEALLALDYPRSRLDIKLILEEDDEETLKAASALDLPGCIEVVIVPPSFPRTKPKAMNYALARARGSLVAIFDAEDIPHRDQLRRAAAAFAAAPKSVACFQGRLGFYNGNQNWLTRQFTIEYASLFEVILPALDKLNLPMLLGGTSNHFRLSALNHAGGWDAHNVTEDADLGIRLARLGYKCCWLNALTLEEATPNLGTWFEQRTRWLRGWIQTYFVHMQKPASLLADLGLWRFLAFQALVGGIVISVMVYPFFVVHFVWVLAQNALFTPFSGLGQNSVLLLNGINLLFGFSVAVELAVLGLYRIGSVKLLLQIPFLPIYWFGISLASYNAAWRFLRRPFEWEKTRHHARRPIS